MARDYTRPLKQAVLTSSPEVFHVTRRRFFIALLGISFAVSITALAQQPTPTSAVSTVEVKALVSEAEVGQKVKLTVVARDADGNIVNEQPSTFFAGPFDIAAADDSGTVSLFGPGEVTAGAIVGSKSGFTTFLVKPAMIKTVEIKSISSPLVVGGTVQLEATPRLSSSLVKCIQLTQGNNPRRQHRRQ